MGANCTNIVNANNNIVDDNDQKNLRKKRHNNEQQLLLLNSVDTGQRQSPIDIDTSLVEMNSELNDLKRTKCLKIIYPKLMSNLIIQNTGYGWKLDLPDMVAAKTELIGGPLKGHIYRMWQFHCHWGPNINIGSEHTVNKRSYSAELHFVHWNTSLYNDPEIALTKPNGLAVVAVFIDIGYQLNDGLEKVLKQIETVKYKGDKRMIDESIDIEKLMPTNRSYWTYNGSLTTPPLFESVTWIIYTTPIYSQHEQIAKFRKLFYTSENETNFGGHLIENYRHTQPLNGRVVKFFRDTNSSQSSSTTDGISIQNPSTIPRNRVNNINNNQFVSRNMMNSNEIQSSSSRTMMTMMMNNNHNQNNRIMRNNYTRRPNNGHQFLR
uniref:Carbonic anhydrase n=1 Tax=Dermatophagoides pteronyssinus TaxID=6956 RepID=A0A6P6XPT4_DERPT|nr:carbonic anhydrase 1-like [Dermatophagoides pteronyssinus]